MIGALFSIRGVLMALERLPLSADGSRCRNSQPDIMWRESKLEVSIGSLLSELRESLRRGARKKNAGKNVGVREDGGHKENMAHGIN